MSAASSARPSSTSSTRPTACCRRSRRPSPSLGIDIRSQANVHLDLEGAPEQVAARVLRADRGPGKGDAGHPADRREGRLGGALPRGGPHRALRVDEREPVDGRKRLGDMAVTEGWAMLMQHLVTEPAWLNRRLDVPPCQRARTRRRRLPPLLRAPLLREAPVRDRVLPGRGSDDDARALPRAPQGRVKLRFTRRATSTTSTAAST